MLIITYIKIKKELEGRKAFLFFTEVDSLSNENHKKVFHQILKILAEINVHYIVEISGRAPHLGYKIFIDKDDLARAKKIINI